MLRCNIFAAVVGRYCTPLRASGMSPTMTPALKMTAERIADSGLASRMMFSESSEG